MITKTLTVAPGVNTHYIYTDKFKTNYISFNFVTKLNKENVHFNAMIPLILTRGTKNYPSQAEINKRLQYLYSADIEARNFKSGEFQIFGITLDILSDKYASDTAVTDLSVELLNDLIFNPYTQNGVFSEQYTESEKISLCDTVDSEINNKSKYSVNRCMDIMCEKEAFALSQYGKKEDIKKITAKSLYQAYEKAISTYNVEIYVVGDCDFDKISAKIGHVFDLIERKPEKLSGEKIVKSVTQVKEFDEICDVNQGKLCLGFRTGRTIEDGDYHITQLFNEIYGASPTSKLFMNVREKMSLCYFCRSIMSQRNGCMIVSSGIETKNKEIAKKAILEQLDSIKNCDISDIEFDSAKRSLKNAYKQIYDSEGALEIWSLVRMLSNNNSSPDIEAEKIDSVIKEDIAKYASGIILDTVYFLKGEQND